MASKHNKVKDIAVNGFLYKPRRQNYKAVEFLLMQKLAVKSG
jgi:predicted CoA-binding protein